MDGLKPVVTKDNCEDSLRKEARGAGALQYIVGAGDDLCEFVAAPIR